MTTPTASVAPATPSTPSSSALPSNSRSTPSNISSSEMRYIAEACRENVRLDGRCCTDYRCYAISTHTANQNADAAAGPLVLSNGSARILLPGGGTHILCSVKADLVRPAPNAPEEGVVELIVDRAFNTSARAANRRQADMELQSVLKRLWLPHVVDRRGLCVIPHQYVWRLNIDLLLLSSQGNVMDVCAMVMRAALQQTRLPLVTPISTTGNNPTTKKSSATSDLAVDGDMTKAMPPPGVNDCPVVVTINVLKCPQTVLLLDATLEEEACASTQVSVAVDPHQGVCGVYKNNTGSVAFGMLQNVTAMAVQASKHVLSMATAHHESSDSAPQDLLQDHFSIR